MSLDDVELWSLARLGRLLYSRQRYERAEAVFEGLVRLRPDDAYCAYALGLVRRDMGDFRGAVESLNRAVSQDSDRWRARLALAELLYEHGYADDARTVLEPVLSAPPHSDEPAVRRARVLLRCWG